MIAVVMFLIAVTAFVLSSRSFHKKGFLLNNAYLYASEKEREEMDKTPYYRQTGIVLLLIGLVFVINGLDALLQTGWLFYAAICGMMVTLVYAIVSGIVIAKREKK